MNSLSSSLILFLLQFSVSTVPQEVIFKGTVGVISIEPPMYSAVQFTRRMSRTSLQLLLTLHASVH